VLLGIQTYTQLLAIHDPMNSNIRKGSINSFISKPVIKIFLVQVILDEKY